MKSYTLQKSHFGKIVFNKILKTSIIFFFFYSIYFLKNPLINANFAPVL